MTLSCSPESQKPKRSNVGSLTKYCRPSAKQVENWSKMPKKTLWRWLEKLEKLEKAHRISRLQNLANVDVSTSTGAVKATFYNLNVLNQLAMVCIDNEKLNEVSYGKTRM